MSLKSLLVTSIVACAVLFGGCSPNKPVHRSSAGSNTPVVTADPGQFDGNWWNRRPFRLVQTNLREYGPPEKSYYTEQDITAVPGLFSNTFGKGKAVYIPWRIGAQYAFKGNYAQRAIFVAGLQHLLGISRDIETDASPLIEMTHQANRQGAFEWIGMINHSGQIGGSMREPVRITATRIRFRPRKPVKAVHLLRSGEAVAFRQQGDWIELTVPGINDFEMAVCVYK